MVPKFILFWAGLMNLLHSFLIICWIHTGLYTVTYPVSCCTGWSSDWCTRFPRHETPVLQPHKATACRLPITRWCHHATKQSQAFLYTSTWSNNTFISGGVCAATANRGRRRPHSWGPLWPQRATQAARFQGYLPGMSDAHPRHAWIMDHVYSMYPSCVHRLIRCFAQKDCF
jgi:hypothetical protein